METTHLELLIEGMLILNNNDDARRAACRAELDALREAAGRYKAALDKIASWGEGAEVTGSFDSPHTARIARQALNGATPCSPSTPS